MKLEKILKRFMKESGVYGIKHSKEVIEFCNNFDEALMPFNAFRWDTSSQGHNYWYSIAMKWILYIYDNLKLIEENDIIKNNITEYAIHNSAYDLIKYYHFMDVSEEELVKIDGYNDLKKLYKSLETTMAVDVNQTMAVDVNQ